LQKFWIPEGTDANWFITIHETIPVAMEYALPEEIMTHLLKKADGIFAKKACPCRTAFDFQEHTHDIGCLHLGPATRAIPPN
jgi:UDP-glucose 4-epimerase